MAKPDFWEEKGSRELIFNRRGAFGKKVFVAKWESRFLAAPLLDTAYDPGYPNLLCSEVSFVPCGATGNPNDSITIPDGIGGTVSDNRDYTHCRITANYEYEKLTGDEPEMSGDCASDILNIGQGREWLNTKKYDTNGNPTSIHAPVEDPTPVLIPTLELTFKTVQSSPPLTAILGYVGRVNDSLWHDAQPGTVLYEGATWDSDYDTRTGNLRYIVQHRFRWRLIGWNWVWHPARQVYDPVKKCLKVDQYGYPEYEGKSAFDMPMEAGVYPMYLTANFNLLWPSH